VQVRLSGNARFERTFDRVPGDVVRTRPPPRVEESRGVQDPIVGKLLQVNPIQFQCASPAAENPSLNLTRYGDFHHATSMLGSVLN